MPKRSEPRKEWDRLAVRIRDLLGTQPVQVQSPPSVPFSAMATDRPSCRAKRAAVSPAEPPPMINRS